jgi:hypothetical protein
MDNSLNVDTLTTVRTMDKFDQQFVDENAIYGSGAMNATIATSTGGLADELIGWRRIHNLQLGGMPFASGGPLIKKDTEYRPRQSSK